jgi:hypothetical protein
MFGQMMIDMHTKTSNDLKAALKDNNIAIMPPAALDDRRMGMLQNLPSAGDSNFDLAHLHQQVGAETFEPATIAPMDRCTIPARPMGQDQTSRRMRRRLPEAGYLADVGDLNFQRRCYHFSKIKPAAVCENIGGKIRNGLVRGPPVP